MSNTNKSDGGDPFRAILVIALATEVAWRRLVQGEPADAHKTMVVFFLVIIALLLTKIAFRGEQ